MSLPRSLQESMKKVLEKTRMVYTITDKLSGQPSGYALMLSDSFVSPDLVQLLPWQVSQSHGDIQSDRERESGSRDLAPGSLASDLDISEDSSMNSTVEDGLSVTGQEILDVSSGSRVKTDNDVRKGTQHDDVDDDTKFSANHNNPSSIINSGTSHKSIAQTFAAEIASKLAAEKNAAGRNMCQSVMEKYSFGSTKSSRESAIKGKYDPSVPGKFSPGIQSRYAAFFTDVGVTQPENYKDKLVRCLLCRKEIGYSHFRRHLRALHEPSVKCDICGGEFSSQRITAHKKICIAMGEMRDKGTRSSTNPSKPENREVKVIFRKMKKQELKLENEEVKFKLISAMRPEIGVKVALKRNGKIKKAMKIFAAKCNANRKKLSFGIGGVKLTGDELVSELEGREIIVHGKIHLT